MTYLKVKQGNQEFPAFKETFRGTPGRIDVTAGTTGFTGGTRTRTYIELEICAEHIWVDTGGHSLMITGKDDGALRQLIEAFKFASEMLTAMSAPQILEIK